MMLTAFAICLLLASACIAFDDWDQWRIIWQDEFDSLDLGKWQHEVTATGGGNSEFQLYTPDGANSFVKDGKLFIKPSLLADSNNPKTKAPYGHEFMSNGVLDVADIYGSCTNSDNDGCRRTGADGNIPPVTSARLRSFQRFSYTFGRVVISAKMPVGDWLWPAIWMLPESWVYGGWPRSGEIDIVEAIGNRDLKTTGGEFIGIQKMGSTLHWGPAPDDNKWGKTHLPKHSDDRNYGDNFHTYIFDWSTNGLRRFHFILNVAVGGTNGFIPDGCVNRGGDSKQVKPWANGDSYVSALKKFYDSRDAWKKTWDDEGDNNAMQVDYIRVYQRK